MCKGAHEWTEVRAARDRFLRTVEKRAEAAAIDANP